MNSYSTPCQVLGYKVGDIFKVVSNTDAFSVGSIVSLHKDDATYMPLFKLISGKCIYDFAEGHTAGAYCNLKDVHPYAGSLYSVQEAYDDVTLLNLSLNRLDRESTKQERLKQLDLVEEELAETKLAAKEEDLLEELDGACDLFVTVAGHMQQLERLGCDVRGALKLVCENNLSKLIDSRNLDELELTEAKYKADGIPVVFEQNQITGLTACKHAVTGKGLKPASFISVDLASCLPKCSSSAAML